MSLHGDESSTDLRLQDTFQDALRHLFFLGLEHLHVEKGMEARLLSKEQLISSLERGYGEHPLESLLDGVCDTDPMKRFCMIPSEVRRLAPSIRVLCVGEEGTQILSMLDIQSTSLLFALPAWWEVPLPLLSVREDTIRVNRKGKELFGEISTTCKDVERALRESEHLLSLRAANRETTVLLSCLDRGIYLMEDVGSDMQTAEDIAFWAAAGKSFVTRLEEQGVRVHRWGTEEEPQTSPEGEILTCVWEDRFLGYVSLDPPKER